MVGSGLVQVGISQATMVPLDTSPGQYRVQISSGAFSSFGIYASFTGISYGQ